VRKAAEKWEPPVKGSKRRKKRVDPTVEGTLAHYVSVFITPVVDGNRMINDTYNRNVNINDVFRPSWETLNAWLYIR
jgi:hypothetical protein